MAVKLSEWKEILRTTANALIEPRSASELAKVLGVSRSTAYTRIVALKAVPGMKVQTKLARVGKSGPAVTLFHVTRNSLPPAGATS